MSRGEIDIGAKTLCGVIVYNARRLEVGIDDGRPHKAEAALLEIDADSVGERRCRGQGHVQRAMCEDRLTVDESPEVACKRSEFVLHRKKGGSVFY